MPPVGGRTRAAVGAAFGMSLAASAVFAGVLAGALWETAGLPGIPLFQASALVALALAIDVAGLPVLAVNRQVPREWGRLLGPVSAALLYGARLGVGPLTILNTWGWWAAFVIGASHGTGAGAAVGLAFAGARAGATFAAGSRRAAPRPGE